MRTTFLGIIYICYWLTTTDIDLRLIIVNEDNAKCVRVLRKPTCNTRLVWAYLALSDNANYASCINGLYAMPIVQRPGQFCWVSFSVEFWQDTNSILLILGKNGSKWSQMVKNTNFGPSPVMNGGPQSKKHCQRHYGPRRWLLWPVVLVW